MLINSGDTQVTAVAPTGLPSGKLTVSLSRDGVSSNEVEVGSQPVLPGFYEFDNDFAAALHTDGRILESAAPGEEVWLYGTGFGTTEIPTPEGEDFVGMYKLAHPVQIQIGSVPTDVNWAGVVAPGLCQFNIKTPDLPDGDYPVTAVVSGVRAESAVRLRIRRSGFTLSGKSRRTKGFPDLYRLVRSEIRRAPSSPSKT